MSKYSTVLPLFHGTSEDSAKSILENGYTELFLTNKKSRAIKYGNCIIVFWKKFEFRTITEKKKFLDQVYKSRYSEDFIDYMAVNNELRPLIFTKYKEKK